MRVGSLFSGYGGLDMAVMDTLGGDLAWYSEIEPAACTILAAHYPGVPNLGDITTVDWATVPPVDVLTGGYPCQPFSHAGQRKGKNDERHLYPFVSAAIDALRPGLVVLENVRGHLTLGFGDVLADLSRMGYDARWGVVSASQAGAPHGRARIFITARPATHAGRGSLAGAGAAGDGLPVSAERGDAPADADGDGHGQQLHARGVGGVEGEAEGGAPERQRPRGESDAGGADAAADADGDAAPGIGDARSIEADRVTAPDGTLGHSENNWGKYGPAIARWEHVLGRVAPAPTVPGVNGRPRLSPRFVEWMMGLPAGHVTGHGLRPAQELKALGNGVCPQQASLALGLLGVTP